MNKTFFSSFLFAIALVFSVAAADLADRIGKDEPAASPASSAKVTRDEIFSSFLGKFVRLSEIPPGIYAWQLGTTLSETTEAALSSFSASRAADEPEAEDYYKSFKFEDGARPWIKFLLRSDGSIVFTSRGLIVKNSEQVQDLENVSNFILTRIKTENGIKFSDKLDESTRNVYSAIYNSIKCRMKLSPLSSFSACGGTIFAASVDVGGTLIGHYFESGLPGYFGEVHFAFVIKSSGQIAKVFLTAEKKNFYSSAKASSAEFLERFAGLLPSDISCDNQQLVTAGERNNGLSYRRLEFIRAFSEAAGAAKARIEASQAKGQM